MVLYILSHWSGTPVRSQLVFCMHFYVWRCIPDVSMEREVLHIYLLLCHLVLCHLFLISSIRSFLILSFIMPIFAWNIPLIPPIFLMKSLVLSFLLFSFISLHCSFNEDFLSLLAIFWNELSWVYLSLSLSPLHFTSLLSSAICKGSSENHFPFLYRIWLGHIWMA